MEILLWLMQWLVTLLRCWDNVITLILGVENRELHFGDITAPTEFDAVSPTAALLWLFRNLASEVVLAGFGGGVFLGLVAICACGITAVHLGFSCCGRARREVRTEAILEPGNPTIEEPDQAETPSFWSRRMLPPPNPRNALTDQERHAFAASVRRALQEAHLSLQALSSQEPASQEVSGVVEIE